MTTQSIPAQGGIPPLPAGAGEVFQGTGSGAGAPAPAPTQVPAQVPVQQPAQTQADPEYAAFLAWKASQSKQPAVPQKAQPAPAQQAPVSQSVPGTSADPTGTAMSKLLLSAAPGVDLNRALGTAIARGYDASLIDEAYIREQVPDNADSVITLAKSLIEHTNAQVNSVINSVYDTAGGQEQWDASINLFNEKAPPAMKSLIKAALDSGDAGKVKDAASMVVDFVKTAGLQTSQQGSPVNGFGATGGTGSTNSPLSGAEYKAELGKLNPRSPEYTSKATELYYRRAAGKQQGM